MVLTDEVKTNFYPAATMETATIAAESNVYSNLTATQTSKPGWFSDPLYPTNNMVARLRNADGYQKVGPNILLKVIADDKFNIRVASGWSGTSPTNSQANLYADFLPTLVLQQLIPPEAPLRCVITRNSCTYPRPKFSPPIMA
jgi:hypothetical protein